MKLWFLSGLYKRLVASFFLLLLMGIICIIPHLLKANPIWISTFGNTGPNALDSPSDVSLNLLGNIYVVDSGNSEVKIFSNTGNFISSFGSFGVGNGQFDTPLGMTQDERGNIYVTDWGGQRFERFDRNGAYLSKVDITGLNTPMGLGYDPSTKKLYVVDNGNNVIQIFDTTTLTQTYIGSFGGPGNNPGQFQGPSYIALARDQGYLYITDSGNARVQVFNLSDNSFVTQFNPPSFLTPTGIFYEPNSQRIYVSDITQNNIQVFSGAPGSIGTFLFSIAGPSDRSDAFSAPRGLYINNTTGQIYVADFVNSRIVTLFDPKVWTNPGTSNLAQLPLDQSLTLDSGYNLIVTGNTHLLSGSNLTLSGGSFSSGSFTLNNGGILSIASLGYANIQNGATLNGGGLNILSGTNAYNKGKEYLILQAHGGINGTFSSIAFPKGFRNFTVRYTPTQVFLVMGSFDFINNPVTQAGKITASKFDAAIYTAQSDFYTVINALSSLPPGQSAQVFDKQLHNVRAFLLHKPNLNIHENTAAQIFSPDRAQPISLQEKQLFTETMQSSVAGGVLLRMRDNFDKQNNKGRQYYLGAKRDISTLAQNTNLNPFWIKTSGVFETQDAEQGYAGYRSKNGSIVVGYEFPVYMNRIVGMAAGYGKTFVDWNDSLGNSSINHYFLSLYTLWKKGIFFSGVNITGGLNRYESNRNINFGSINRVAKANFTGWDMGGFVSGGMDIKTKAFDIKPFATAGLVRITHNKYTEQGAGSLDLSVGRMHGDYFSGQVGFKVSKTIQEEKGNWTPKGQISFKTQRALNTLKQPTTLANTGTFTVEGAALSHNYVSLGVGFDSDLNSNIKAGLFYNADISKTDKIQTIQFTVSIPF